ncbi:sulfite exporter TauE/SafE family protein [Balneola sp. MJW-20]|uniref:sulfite exporter TauE/SafE family protein n=1 Tax=Gracilimonas aurantiaca TaxID=3234185 RepID=UPI00346783B1
MLEPLILLAIGLIAGIIAGLMGVGGGIIFTPVLYFLFDEAGVEDPVIWTIGSGLFCTFIAAFGSTIRQTLQDNQFWKEGIQLGLFGAIGVFFGKLVVTSPYYSRTEFAIFFSFMLVYAAVMMFRRGADQQDEYLREFEAMNLKAGFVTGGIGGFIAALAGVGGGGIMVPIMNLFFKQPFRKTVSVSQLGMTIMVFTGWFQLALLENNLPGISPYTFGFVDFGAALPLSIGGLIGGFAGAFLNHKVKRRYLQWGFAILAFVMASRLIWTTFR